MPAPDVAASAAGGTADKAGFRVIKTPLGERHTTKENVSRFFDPLTYKSLQKRPGPPQDGLGTPPVAKAKPMAKHDLIEKFQLAAQLNGYRLEDIAASWPGSLNCIFSNFSEVYSNW